MENIANNPIVPPDAVRAKEEYLVKTGIDIGTLRTIPTVINIEGHSYIYQNGKWQLVDEVLPKDPLGPITFNTFSLGGLVDFIRADIDGMFSDPTVRHLVSVQDARTVAVISPLTQHERKRFTIAQCQLDIQQIPFGRYLDAEEFQIMVQTRMLPSENRNTVLGLAGAIKSEQSMQTADDGFSQKVTIKRGVATVGDVVVKNPVDLYPIRTFFEVEQPSSPFVLRFNEQAQVALFEGDGGAWKLEAVQNIKKWLIDALRDCNVEIIA